ncbi:MAG: TonB-dependent receptor [Emcibacter sp.]|nr:TonB-dependent receptor [Emcibacter sp.]
MKILYRNIIGITSTIGLGLTTPSAYAKDVVVREAGLEEIVITARKRSENMQDVALSVSAMSQSEIERQFSTDIRDLVGISPNLVIDDTSQGPGGLASIYIRGIGVSDVEKNFDPAVGVVVDGVFLGQNSGSLTRSIDIASIEVLRGPQGTLFGRNTIGGVIKLQRSQPTGELGGKVRAGYGNYETLTLDGILNFGVTEKLAVKLSGSYKDQGKGYYYNSYFGRDQGRAEYTSIGANVLFSPTETVSVEYTFQAERTNQDTPAILNVSRSNQLFCSAYGYCAPDIHTPVSGSRHVSQQDEPGLFDATYDADTHIVEVHWDIANDLQFDYIFGSWQTEETTLADWDATPETLFHTSRPAEFGQTSHEMRLTYDSDGPFSGVLGAYLWNSNYEIRLRSYIGFAVPDVVLDLPQTTKQTTDSWAVFLEGDYAITDALSITVGGRFTRDEKTTDQVGIVVADASHSWKKFTPKVAVTYAINDDSMVYATFSEGYRSGGFNGRVDSVETATTPYNGESVDNYEIGFKSEFMENKLRLNGSAFIMKYKDKQEEIQLPSETSGTGQVTRVVNASTATIKGIELDALYSPIAGLTFRANIGLLDAGYDDFLFDTGDGIVDFSHLNLRRSPKISSNLSFNYEWNIGSGVANVGAGWHHIDPYETDFANKPELTNDKSQELIDASIGYAINNMQINVYGRNLTNEDGYTIGFDVAGLWSYVATRNPRTYGVEVNYSF